MQVVSFGIGELHIDLLESGVYGGEGVPVRSAAGRWAARAWERREARPPASANVMCPWAISKELEGETEQERERDKNRGHEKVGRERSGLRKTSTVVPGERGATRGPGRGGGRVGIAATTEHQ